MSSAYPITGPTQIGTTTKNNTILGDVILSDITTSHGDILYADGSNKLARLAPGTNGQMLRTNGAGASPSWVSSAVSTNITGFSARKSGTQGGITSTPIIITNWSTATTPPEYDNTGGEFNPVTGVFTAGSTGEYHIDVSISYKDTNNAGHRILDLFLNGSTVIYQHSEQPGGNVNLVHNISISTSISLSVGDTLVCRIYRSGGTSTIIVQASPETWMTISQFS
jgi:hypothetical protein